MVAHQYLKGPLVAGLRPNDELLRLGVATKEPNPVLEATRGGQLPRRAHRVGAVLDADRFGSEVARRQYRRGARAAGDIEAALPRLQAGELEGPPGRPLAAGMQLLAEQPRALRAARPPGATELA